jgi:hypothetical protein
MKNKSELKILIWQAFWLPVFFKNNDSEKFYEVAPVFLLDSVISDVYSPFGVIYFCHMLKMAYHLPYKKAFNHLPN